MTARRPASRQEDEAAFGLRPFDDRERDALSGVGGRFAGIALTEPSQFDGFVVTACAVCASRSTWPRSSAPVGVTWSASRWPCVSMPMWIFEPFLRSAPS